MSPTKRASAVAGLRRAVEPVPVTMNPAAPPPAPETTPPKPARVTLNLPPSLMRDVERWALDAADTLTMPRVSVQDTLRAMIRACLTDDQARSAALAQVHQEDSKHDGQ